MMTKPISALRLLSVADVATFLAVSTKTVRRMIEHGELPFHRVGRQLRASEIDLQRFLAGSRESGYRMTINVQQSQYSSYGSL